MAGFEMGREEGQKESARILAAIKKNCLSAGLAAPLVVFVLYPLFRGYYTKSR
jgi:hypothetical protein